MSEQEDYCFLLPDGQVVTLETPNGPQARFTQEEARKHEPVLRIFYPDAEPVPFHIYRDRRTTAKA